MEVIIEIIENTKISEEYFKILLGGLFGIATIVVAVTSIASNVINKKYLNMNVNKMARYRIWFQFLPIYYLVIYNIIIMKWNWMISNDFITIGGVIIFIGITTFCSYYAAQYSINTEKFQEKLLKVSEKNLKKKLQENNYENSIVIDYLKEAHRTVNENDCRIFQDKISREKMYNKYIKLVDIDNLEDNDILEILNILIEEFGPDKAFEMCNQFRIGQLTYILVRSINDKTDFNIMKICIERIHSYFLYQHMVDGIKYENYKEIVVFNKKAMLLSKRYFIATMQYLMETKFVIKDAFYLSNIIRQIYDIEQFINMDDIEFDDRIKAFATELIKCKGLYKWPHDESERDQAIQTALLMIGGEKNEKKNI